MIPVYRTRAAERDLEDIWLAIAEDNPAAATCLVRAIAARIDRLSRFPRLGVRRRDIASAARALVEGPYLILFEVQPDTDEGPVEWVEIVPIVDGRRDLTDLG